MGWGGGVLRLHGFAGLSGLGLGSQSHGRFHFCFSCLMWFYFTNLMRPKALQTSGYRKHIQVI